MMNFKPINDVPMIEELNEGDKLLVNSGGKAMQIDAEKVNPILKAPEAEELAEGDKILVNSGGSIVKVDASKVGGKGGGGLIYTDAEPNSNNMTIMNAYADPEYTTMLTYEEGAALINSGAKIQIAMDEQIVWMTPVTVVSVAEAKAMQCILIVESMVPCILVFSDTNMDA